MIEAPRPLVVVSIFGPSERNLSWYRLQKDFLARTTDTGFDYHVILNGADPAGFDPDDVLVANPQNLGHGEALMQAVSFLRSRSHEAYLLLDSDCFPVSRGWYGILTAQMLRLGKTFAAPVRTENLDLFPHPCAVFLRPGALHDDRLEFRRGTSCRNMLGAEVKDTGAALHLMGDLLLPLLRTNVVNLHPVAAAVYSHLFYHHGAGSRTFEFRVLKKFDYHGHWWPADDEPALADRLFRDLLADPEEFLGRLMGRRTAFLERFASSAKR